MSDRNNEHASFPETAESVFNPEVALKHREMAAITNAMFTAVARARELAPPRVTGHETD